MQDGDPNLLLLHKYIQHSVDAVKKKEKEKTKQFLLHDNPA